MMSVTMGLIREGVSSVEVQESQTLTTAKSVQ